MLVLLGAMKREIAGLKRKMVIEDTVREGDSCFYKGKYGGKDILLGHTGIGKKRAEAATEFILDRYPATAVISFGISGALVKNLAAGDIVLGKTLYSEVEDQSGNRMSPSPVYSDAGMISRAAEVRSVSAELFQMNSLTTRNPVCAPEEKLAMGTAYDAGIVDMESYWIAGIASAGNIPFLSVRAISDCAGDSLPPLERFLGPDGLYLKKAILYFLTHPLELPGLFQLYRKTRKAEKNLTDFMDSFLNGYGAN